jgi:RNA polymerase sigma-70 factor (ECF subfamily)
VAGVRDKTTETTIKLVRRARGGDDRAFEELVKRYRERIYALALHITGNQSDADDVAQDVFLSAHRHLGGFEERSQFFTWIYRMAVNRSLNVRRSRKRRGETTQLEDPRVERAVAVDAQGNPARAAELRQTYARLLSALDHLPGAMRTSVVLVILQGLSQAEAAAVQNCSPGTIAWRIHVARQRLRDALQAQLEQSPEERRREPSSELADLLDRWGWPVLTPF